MVNKEKLEKVEDMVMKELDFYSDDLRSLDSKKAHLNVSIVINKLANTVLQTEAVMQRAYENDLKAQENQRLVKRFNTK